jgi:hypothetical protein
VLSLRPRSRRWAPWANAFLGVWVMHAPLVFWAESAAAYLNGTVVGILLFALAVVIPRSLWSRGGPHDERDVPPGWSFNPSSWVQRTPIIAMAWINFFVARYMAAYQLGHIGWPWDPIFGDGTHRVLTSEVSEAFPVSDAGLGAAAYAIEALIGFMGSASRWRSAPWTVALFGVLVVPVGIVSTVLLMLQPIAVGAWCTLCLVAAALMLAMAALALPEVAAMIEFLLRARRRGESAWRVFWRGGEDAGATVETPQIALSSPPGAIVSAMLTGVSAPWTLAASLALGVWLMLAPTALGIEAAAENAHYVLGALVCVTVIVSMAEPARAARFANIVLALAIAAAPLVMEGSTAAGNVNAAVVGAALIVLAKPRGRIAARYGEWTRWIR